MGCEFLGFILLTNIKVTFERSGKLTAWKWIVKVFCHLTFPLPIHIRVFIFLPDECHTSHLILKVCYCPATAYLNICSWQRGREVTEYCYCPVCQRRKMKAHFLCTMPAGRIPGAHGQVYRCGIHKDRGVILNMLTDCMEKSLQELYKLTNPKYTFFFCDGTKAGRYMWWKKGIFRHGT